MHSSKATRWCCDTKKSYFWAVVAKQLAAKNPGRCNPWSRKLWIPSVLLAVLKWHTFPQVISGWNFSGQLTCCWNYSLKSFCNFILNYVNSFIPKVIRWSCTGSKEYLNEVKLCCLIFFLKPLHFFSGFFNEKHNIYLKQIS